MNLSAPKSVTFRKPFTIMDQQNKKTQHDPHFVPNLLKAFAAYPSTLKDFNDSVRHRQELYHETPFSQRMMELTESALARRAASGDPHSFEELCRQHPTMERQLAENPPTDSIAYLAPGGLPSSEAESIFLQTDDEKVE